MLHLYTWRTPNGRKVPILLAELGWRCELHLVDLGKNEQKAPAYLAINPNGKIPALVDGDVVVFESGAILEYLADRAGRFLPREPGARAEVLSWCWWQVGGPGPFFGQLGSFKREQPQDQHAIEKMLSESRRLAGVLDTRLVGRTWVAGDYSIADMMLYPWFDAVANGSGEVLDGMDRVRDWMSRMAARAPVQAGMALEVSARGTEAHEMKGRDEAQRAANAQVSKRAGKDDVHEQREAGQEQEGAISARVPSGARPRAHANAPHSSRRS